MRYILNSFICPLAHLFTICTLIHNTITDAQTFPTSLSYIRTRRLLPADSYKVLGEPIFKRFGQCNLTYAWLTSPPSSSLDAYGHAQACTRLQLLDGQIIRPERETKLNQANEDLKRINQEWVASLVDLETLDMLIRADSINLVQHRQLAGDPRYFFLADRVGDLNLMAVFRPDKQIKLELINPLSTDHFVTPQHVLCSRKQCPATSLLNTHESDPTNGDKPSNSSLLLSNALSRTERQNRELYIQLLISRVACALLGFMCIVFAITSLTLCLRLRRNPNYYRKAGPPSEISNCREPNQSPSFYQVNGKIGMNQTTPMFMTDASPRHFGLTHLPSDTTSLNNVIMTGSNISTCEGPNSLANAPFAYAAVNPQYGQLPAGYHISSGQLTSYQDSSGLITLYPVPSRNSISSTQRGLLISCPNGSASPAPSQHSQTDFKNGVTRSGSLGRHPRYSMCSGEIGRRKLIQQCKRAQQQHQARQQQTQNNHPLLLNEHQQFQPEYPVNVVNKFDPTQRKFEDLITFAQNSNFPNLTQTEASTLHNTNNEFATQDDHTATSTEPDECISNHNVNNNEDNKRLMSASNVILKNSDEFNNNLKNMVAITTHNNDENTNLINHIGIIRKPAHVI